MSTRVGVIVKRLDKKPISVMVTGLKHELAKDCMWPITEWTTSRGGKKT
jgi:hypothetical protein